MAGNKGLGLLLAGGAALLLMSGKKKKRKSSGSSSPTSPAYMPSDSDVISDTPPPAPKPKGGGPALDPYPVDEAASDIMIAEYAADPLEFMDEYNVSNGDEVTDVIYRTMQSGCPETLNQNDARHSLCIKEWKRIRARVEQISIPSDDAQSSEDAEPIPEESSPDSTIAHRQQMLNVLGYQIPVTGKSSTSMKNAIKSFQRDWNDFVEIVRERDPSNIQIYASFPFTQLKADGIWGQNTNARAEVALARFQGVTPFLAQAAAQASSFRELVAMLA